MAIYHLGRSDAAIKICETIGGMLDPRRRVSLRLRRVWSDDRRSLAVGRDGGQIIALVAGKYPYPWRVTDWLNHFLNGMLNVLPFSIPFTVGQARMAIALRGSVPANP